MQKKMEGKRSPPAENPQADSRAETGVSPGAVEAGRDSGDAPEHGVVAEEDSDASLSTSFADALAPEIRRDVDRFVSFVECGIDFWIKAGEILVKMKKADPDVFSVISRCHPWVTVDVLETLHSIGMKAIHPRVLLLPPKVASSVASMPYEAQQYVVENANKPLPIMREGNRRLTDMSRAEAKKVFTPEGMAELQKQARAINETLGVWELSVLGTTLHARRVSSGIAGTTLKLAGGICYVRLTQKKKP